MGLVLSVGYEKAWLFTEAGIPPSGPKGLLQIECRAHVHSFSVNNFQFLVINSVRSTCLLV